MTDADGVAEAANTYDRDGPGASTQVSRFGRLTRFVYLPGGVTVTMGEDEHSPANTYVHDAHGRLLAAGRRARAAAEPYVRRMGSTRSPSPNANGAVTTVAWDERSRPVRRVAARRARVRLHLRRRRPGAVKSRRRPARPSGTGTRAPSVPPPKWSTPKAASPGCDVRDGLVHRVTDPDGVTLTFTFDADGGLRSTTDALGNTARIERDDGRPGDRDGHPAGPADRVPRTTSRAG